MFNTYEELRKFCQEQDIRMIDFKMIDLLGRWRHLTIPADRFTEKTLKNGIGFDGSNYGFAPIEKRDNQFLQEGNVFHSRLIEIWIKKKREEASYINKISNPAEFGYYYDL